jgi:hypothetical protein
MKKFTHKFQSCKNRSRTQYISSKKFKIIPSGFFGNHQIFITTTEEDIKGKMRTIGNHLNIKPDQTLSELMSFISSFSSANYIFIVQSNISFH